MNKLLIAVAAAALAGALAPCAEAGFDLHLPAAPTRMHASPVKSVGCDEDCAEYLEDKGYELLERADARDEEVDTPRRSLAREAREEPVVRRAHAAADQPTSVSKSEAPRDSKDENKQATPKSPESKKAVASATPGSCRQYFPSVGMTLSVPCE
jgi:hypothetical protein